MIKERGKISLDAIIFDSAACFFIPLHVHIHAYVINCDFDSYEKHSSQRKKVRYFLIFAQYIDYCGYSLEPVPTLTVYGVCPCKKRRIQGFLHVYYMGTMFRSMMLCNI